MKMFTYLPDEFEVSYIFFLPSGSNKLYLKKNRLIFESVSGFPPEISRKLEISPSEDKWAYFWSQMDEIGAWSWDEKYVPPEGDIMFDGDMTDIKIVFQGREINSFWWCNGPPRGGIFYQTMQEFTGLQIGFPGGVKENK